MKHYQKNKYINNIHPRLYVYEGKFNMCLSDHHIHSQSHVSENLQEVKIVKEMFPDSNSYTDVYHKHNLLTNKVEEKKTIPDRSENAFVDTRFIVLRLHRR